MLKSVRLGMNNLNVVKFLCKSQQQLTTASHTIADSGFSLTDSPLSMSYCEGVTGRLGRAGRPLSAPLTAGMFDEARSLPPGPHSPRVLEVVEKSESVSWKLQYEAALTNLPPPLPSASPSPSNKRKISPQSPQVLRKCKSGSVVAGGGGGGLMTRSLDLSLARSHSHTGTSSDHPALCRTVRGGSCRRKILPSFETLSESTESESDSPVERGGSEPGNTREDVVTPAPVDISATGSDDVICEISSSSEIEIGIEQDNHHLSRLHQDIKLQEEHSHSDSPSDTDPDVTIRSNIKKTSECLVEKPVVSDLESPDDTEPDLTIKTGESFSPAGLPSIDISLLSRQSDDHLPA